MSETQIGQMRCPQGAIVHRSKGTTRSIDDAGRCEGVGPVFRHPTLSGTLFLKCPQGKKEAEALEAAKTPKQKAKIERIHDGEIVEFSEEIWADQVA